MKSMIGKGFMGCLFGAALAFVALNAPAVEGKGQPPSASVIEVVARDGNLYCMDTRGIETQLTSSGLDFEPSLSDDGKWVTFVRENPDFIIHSGIADCPDAYRDECLSPAREIWVAVSDGSSAPRQVVTREHFDGKILDYFWDPVLSPNNAEVFFFAPRWVTTHAIYKVNLQSSSVQFVTPGRSFDIVRWGPWAGHLIVEKHLYMRGGGSYDWKWLVSPEGKLARTWLVGGEEFSLERKIFY